jgi:hypothetical protein
MIQMKIRDLLVIVFTAVVALLLFLRSARADGSCPEDGAGAGGDGRGGHEGASSLGASWDIPFGLTEWMCSDVCASTCGDTCGSACSGAVDASCVLGCYPACARSCYLDCAETSSDEAAPGKMMVAIAHDPARQQMDIVKGGPAFPQAAASGAAPGQSPSCSASPGAATATLLNSLAAFLAVGLVARRRRR